MEAGGLRGQGQLSLHNKTLDLKKKRKRSNFGGGVVFEAMLRAGNLWPEGQYQLTLWTAFVNTALLGAQPCLEQWQKGVAVTRQDRPQIAMHFLVSHLQSLPTPKLATYDEFVVVKGGGREVSHVTHLFILPAGPN